MALEPIALEAILLECRNDPRPRRLLSLGYPDVLAPQGYFDHIPERKDATAIRGWHQWAGRVPDTDALFKSLNIEPVYVDISRARGPERIEDLNTLESDSDKFDIILDPGTTEHIFNIGNVFTFIAKSCKLGGLIIHTNPLNMANHGFWSLNPTAYWDWYTTNGFRFETMKQLSGPVANRIVTNLNSATGRFEARPNSTMFAVVRKEIDAVLRWPTQTKYRMNPNLKVVA